jgi:hypothetical protein
MKAVFDMARLRRPLARRANGEVLGRIAARRDCDTALGPATLIRDDDVFAAGARASWAD